MTVITSHFKKEAQAVAVQVQHAESPASHSILGLMVIHAGTWPDQAGEVKSSIAKGGRDAHAVRLWR
jgi:hypothetical protein